MGDGWQFVSWVHEHDFCRAVEFLLEHNTLAGPVNVAAPNALPNADLMRTLRLLLGQPVGLPAPRWMLELGALVLRTETELILKSRRVVPTRLEAAGFEFRYPALQTAVGELEARHQRARSAAPGARNHSAGFQTEHAQSGP
jgi:NAD dependent epimerase/dehydratase family enzyme